MKEYKVRIQRTYNTTIILKFPDDGRLHWNTIDDKLRESDSDLWDLIAEKELQQMNVDDITWEIQEINTTITGALSNDTGPRN